MGDDVLSSRPTTGAGIAASFLVGDGVGDGIALSLGDIDGADVADDGDGDDVVSSLGDTVGADPSPPPEEAGSDELTSVGIDGDEGGIWLGPFALYTINRLVLEARATSHNSA